MLFQSRDRDPEPNWDLIPQEVAPARRCYYIGEASLATISTSPSGDIIESKPRLEVVLLRIILDVLL